MRTLAQNRRAEHLSLGILELFVGLSAVGGGIYLMLQPRGTAQMTLDMLRGTPFADYFVPGLLLTAVVGITLLIGGTLEVTGRSWSRLASLGAGSILLGWIVIEMLLLGMTSPLQPGIFVLALVTLALAVHLWLTTMKRH